MTSWLNRDTLLAGFKAFLILVSGIPLCYWLSSQTRGVLTRRHSAHHGLLGGQFVLYGGVVLIVVAALDQLGFSLTPLLGAAGIVGIALGFASQTSVSNVISGIFILTEQAFAVGDVISVDDSTGVVLSIDLLSVKVRQFDNRFVRIPNEQILKSKVTNITRFPIRRVDLDVSVAYREDLEAVSKTLVEIARADNRILKLPEPLVYLKGFGDSGVNMLLLCWVPKEDWFAVRNSLPISVKRRFDDEGVEIPFPHLKVYGPNPAEALPLRIMSGA